MKYLVQIAGLSLLLAFGASAQSNFAGTYLADLSANDLDTDYSGTLAVIVRTNNQATLLGSATGPTNTIGLHAQFKVQNDGTWSYQTNGISAHGQVFTNGALTGELAWSGGRVSTIDNGDLQSDTGPFQGRAGYYAGTWSGGGKSGKLFGILTAFGDLTYSVLDANNKAFDGGGPDELDELSNAFASLSVSETEVYGTLTNGTLTIGGTYVTAASVPVTGKFRMTRTSFVPRKLPPTITVAPADKTVTYGANTSFAVTATGATPLYYQWYSNNVAIDGATTRTLAVNNVQISHDGTIYKVVVENSVGDAFAEAVLTAVPESVPPTLNITSPVANQRVTSGSLLVTGTAADNVRLESVWYQVNGGTWSQANGTASWSATAALKGGTNVVAAFSMDSSGNLSPTKRVTFFLVVPGNLTLVTNGVGGITRSFALNAVEVGKKYTVTAVPGAGQVFSNWVGSVNSSAAALSFLMQSNMVLQANFVANPFLAAKGIYNGLFSEETRAHSRSGFFTLTLGEKGGYTASLKRGTNAYSFAGQFNVAGHATGTAVVGGVTWTVTMTLDFETGKVLTGTVGTSQWLANLTANRAVFDAVVNQATKFKGRYTLILPGNNNATTSPAGDGYGTVVVGVGGYATLGGFTADGNTLSQSVALSGSGDWPLYVPLSGGTGSLWGWVQFNTNGASSTGMDGYLNWIKPAKPGATYYPLGFTNYVSAGGSRYTAPVNATTRVINLISGIVSFQDGNVSSPFTNSVTLTTANQIVNGSANSLSMTINTVDGTFSGKVKVPGTTRTNSFKGALLQDLNSGYGYFLGTSQSGGVFFGAP